MSAAVERRSPLRQLGPVGGIAGTILLLLYCTCGPPGTMACGAATGYGDDIVVPVERCAATARRLGTPVTLSLVGVGCTNYESGGDSGPGDAWGVVPISGPLGRASYDFRASLSGDTWLVSQGLVTFPDGTKTDVVACLGPTGMRDLQNRAMREIMQRACDDDRADTCHSLGEALRDGRFGPADRSGAKSAFDHACRLGNAPSCAARDAIR